MIFPKTFWHVFSPDNDDYDFWTDVEDQAEAEFDRCKERFGSARLYSETYQTREDYDEMRGQEELEDWCDRDGDGTDEGVSDGA